MEKESPTAGEYEVFHRVPLWRLTLNDFDWEAQR
jgi:hypothetical protein